jgi:LPXTG-site transpeptidase (sortase) family protein
MSRATPVVWRSVRVLSTACFIAGAALLAWPFFHSALSGYSTGRAQAEALAAWDRQAAHPHPATPSVGSAGPAEEMVLEIPRLGLRRIVPDGATVAQLQRYGVGHISWTAFPPAEPVDVPGQLLQTAVTADPATRQQIESGTVGIAGHRTTYGAPFFRLGDLTPGDAIVLQYAGRRYVYRMEQRLTVSPTDSDVLAAGSDHVALVTCTPAFSAAFRMVVLGRLESVTASVAH